MFTPEMMESVKKVEATRASRLGMEPRRMTAEEKDQLLREFHPDYRAEAFEEIKVGPNKGQKANKRAGAYAAFQQPSSEGSRRSLEDRL